MKCDYLVQVTDSFRYSGHPRDDHLQFLIAGCDENDPTVLVVQEMSHAHKLLLKSPVRYYVMLTT